MPSRLDGPLGSGATAPMPRTLGAWGAPGANLPVPGHPVSSAQPEVPLPGRLEPVPTAGL